MRFSAGGLYNSRPLNTFFLCCGSSSSCGHHWPAPPAHSSCASSAPETPAPPGAGRGHQGQEKLHKVIAVQGEDGGQGPPGQGELGCEQGLEGGGGLFKGGDEEEEAGEKENMRLVTT